MKYGLTVNDNNLLSNDFEPFVNGDRWVVSTVQTGIRHSSIMRAIHSFFITLPVNSDDTVAYPEYLLNTLLDITTVYVRLHGDIANEIHGTISVYLKPST
jgi:hypothetical protein